MNECWSHWLVCLLFTHFALFFAFFSSFLFKCCGYNLLTFMLPSTISNPQTELLDKIAECQFKNLHEIVVKRALEVKFLMCLFNLWVWVCYLYSTQRRVQTGRLLQEMMCCFSPSLSFRFFFSFQTISNVLFSTDEIQCDQQCWREHCIALWSKRQRGRQTCQLIKLSERPSVTLGIDGPII